MSYRVKIIDLLSCSLFIAIFKPYFLPELVRQGMKILILVGVFIFLFTKLGKKKLLNCSLVFGASILLSGLVNYVGGSYSFKALLDSFLFALCFYDMYTFASYCYYKDLMKNLLNCFYKMNVVYCVLTIVSVILSGTMDNSNEIAYFFGNKFTSSYLFVLLISLYGATHDIGKHSNKVKLLILTIFSILFSLYIGCATTTVSLTIILGLCIMPKKIRGFIIDGKTVLIAILLSSLIVFVFESVLQIDFINDVVSGFFKKTYTITGRVEIYGKYLTDIILNKFWLGYGYSNGEMMQLTGVYANAQNGMLEQFVNFGCIGIASLVYTIYFCLKSSMKSNLIFCLGLVVYGMIFASVVEVSINLFFLLGLCLIRWNKGNP